MRHRSARLAGIAACAAALAAGSASAETQATVPHTSTVSPLPAAVRIAVRPVRGRSGNAARAKTRIVAGHVGRNSFRLRPRFGRKVLAPGAYRLTLVATDRAGNRSRSVERRFVVTD